MFKRPSLTISLPSLFFPECGGNITNQENGIITSPNYPEKYSSSSGGGNQQCNWFIHVRPGHKIHIYFEEFEVEGKPSGENEEQTKIKEEALNQHPRALSQLNVVQNHFTNCG